MLLLKESALNLKEKTTQNCFFYIQIACKDFYDRQVKYYFFTIPIHDY